MSGSANPRLQLPVSRVKTIMKSSPDVDSVRQEPLMLVTHVTELFIADLARRAYEESGNSQVLEYKHIANLVQRDDTLDFLREILPCKITVKQFKELMAKKALKQNEDTESSEEDDDYDEAEEVEDEAIKDESIMEDESK